MAIAIIVAGGKGKRMRTRINKLFLLLNKNPIILQTLKRFQESKQIKQIVLVTHPSDLGEFEEIVNSNKLSKVKKIVAGGKERQDSVYNGLKCVKAYQEEVIVVHNAANPFVDEEIISKIIHAAKKYGAAVAGFPAKDTIKVMENGFVKQTLPRDLLWQVQTPQAMKYFLIKKAFDIAARENFYGTDDVSLVEKIGGQVKVVYCDRSNIKITDQHDLVYANKLVLANRIGIGQDSHKFGRNRAGLVLGGIKIDSKLGFDANSDGDVILHALFNAISTAIGEKSLGFYADKLCKEGISDSKQYLKVMLDKLNEKNLKISNIAVMVEGKIPKIDIHSGKIKRSLARILKLKESSIGIAATTGEELTGFGRGEGMQCFAAVSLKS